MKKYVAFVLIAGVLWGTTGTFTRYLSAWGFTAADVVILRCGIAAAAFAVTILCTDPRLFRVKLRDAWCFAGAGLCALLFFIYCYNRAIVLTSLATAAILLYTAPAIVMLLSLLLFGEKLTRRKLLALVLAILGCALVSGLGEGLTVTPRGLAFGLCSGLGYALYSVFARLALDRGYDSLCINFWSCLLAAAGAAVIWGTRSCVSLAVSAWPVGLCCLATGILTCFLPYLLYTAALTGLEAGRAAVMASVEPVVAALMGMLVFRELPGLTAALGICLVLTAVVLLNLSPGGKHHEP